MQKMLRRVSSNRSESRHARRLSFLFLLAASFLFSACLLDPERNETSRRIWDGTPGFVQLNVGLERNENRFLAKSTADSTFGLDSLIVVLTATGADTLVYRYAISGRPDTGVISVPPMVYTLNPLLNWKARFYSIDTTVSPMRRDTVHIDSVTFAVRPADTAFVSKTVSAAFSVVRARFISSNQDSLGVSIRFLRLKVGGVTRDSLDLFGTSYSAVAFANGQTGWIVQDSGRIQKSNDSGKTWYPQNSGTTVNLRTVTFPSATVGYVAGEGGLIKKTTNGGTSWSTLDSRTDLRLNRIYFVTPDSGYVAGDSGFIMKTVNGGTNWRPVSGGWFKSLNTSATLNDVGFINGTTGFAVGTNGIIHRTTNSGGSWALAATTSKTLNAVRFPTASNGYTVGDSGVVLRYNGTSWAGQVTVTGSDLQGVFVKGSDSAWAVGTDEGLIRNTTNGGGNWGAIRQGWLKQTTAVAADTNRSWYGVSFGSVTIGYIAGAGGVVRRTTNGGATWSTVTMSAAITTALRDVSAGSTTRAIAAGDSGRIARTTNGTSWDWINTGAGNVRLNGVVMINTTTGWVVGESNTIRSTTNTGGTWTSRNQTGTWNSITRSSTRIFVAGNSGLVRRSSSTAGTANFTQLVSNGNMSTHNLYGIAFSTTNADTGYVVGAGGRIYRTVNGSVTAASVSWTQLTSPTAQDLSRVRFINGRTGWITGINGGVWRTIDAGDNWSQQYHDVPGDSLRGIWSTLTDTAYFVGSNGAIRKTTSAGFLISGKPTPQKLNGVFFPTSTVGYIVGSSGAISKSTTAGLRWTAQTNAASDSLNAVHFVHADTGWAVGNTGTILKTVNGGTNWVAQTSPVSAHLRKVRFFNGQRGWAAGDGGKIIRTVNGGTTWTEQESGTTKNLRGLHAMDADTVYAVGQDGVIRKTLNGGVLVIFYKNLNGFFARNDSLYVVGDDGLAYRSRNGGGGWTPLSGASANLNAIFSAGSNAHMVGDNGVYYTILHTSADSALTTRTTNTTQHLRSVWGSPTVGATSVLMVGDSGIIGRVVFVATPPALDTFSFRENLRAIHCVKQTQTDCWIVGSRETILRNTAPNTVPWSLMGIGAKRFDFRLTSKYLRPGSDTVILQAIDRPSPLRGFQRILNVTVGAGQDSTINTGLTRCGYGGATPDCVP